MEHIKRCYLIPFAIGIALLIFLHSADVFLLVDPIDMLLPALIAFAALMLFYIGIADSISAIINRRTATSTAIGIAFLVFAPFAMIMLEIDFKLIFILPFISIAGAVSAFFNDRTATAIVSGTAVIVFYASGEVTDMVVIFFIGVGILAVAFITHTNMALSKLRVLYLISPIFFAPLLFLVILLDFSSGRAPFELYAVRQALLQSQQSLIAGGCIIMGINSIIYSSDSNINPRKDSLKL